MVFKDVRHNVWQDLFTSNSTSHTVIVGLLVNLPVMYVSDVRHSAQHIIASIINVLDPLTIGLPVGHHRTWITMQRT